MKIWALLSWYDEQPGHLREMVESVAPLVDGVIAVDGAYALYPNAKPESSREEHLAIVQAASECGLERWILNPGRPWIGGEVRKRAAMFHYALSKATPHEDWFLIMDGDMLLDDNSVNVQEARAALENTPADVAEVTFAELAYGSSTHTVHCSGFRSLFRALPGLTVEGTHWIYTVPDETRPAKRRFLWHPVGGHSAEKALDLRDCVRLLHRPHVRDAERVKSRQEYYVAREQARAEVVPTAWD